MTQSTVRGALLDVDGTLLDSNDAHALAWMEALEEQKLSFPVERIRPLIGMGGDKLLAALAKIDHESELGKTISERRGAIFKKTYLAQLRPFPGARELLQAMKDRGIVRVVATSAQGNELNSLLEQAGVRDLVQDEATSSDAEHSKPDPDILHAAIALTKLAPHELVMIGDTKYDVEAARRAGVRMIALRCGGSSDEDLAGAAAIYDDPAELLKDRSSFLFG